MTRKNAPASAQDGALVESPLLDMQYSTGVNKLCVLFEMGKDKVHKRFRVIEPENKEKADHSALINLKQNKITITEHETKNKFALIAQGDLIPVLQGVKKQTDAFHANKQGLIYLHVINQGAEPTSVVPKKACKRKAVSKKVLRTLQPVE